ncbi:MAG: macro domain-containing protein [Spirochaetota bacterium]|nr:MAG: macro domain-containing protein [Spirochaetota bacterium]
MEGVDVELIKGDITERSADAIINTANNMLILGSGLGGAIKSKGGASIVEECTQHGTIEVGDAVVTNAGKLKSKYVIHAALTEFDGPILEENIVKSLLSSLRLAKKHKMKSLAIPDMSLGIVRFSPELCAQVMLTTLKKFLEEENKTLRTVEIVVWDIETYRIYKKVYEEIIQ